MCALLENPFGGAKTRASCRTEVMLVGFSFAAIKFSGLRNHLMTLPPGVNVGKASSPSGREGTQNGGRKYPLETLNIAKLDIGMTPFAISVFRLYLRPLLV